MLIRSGLRTGSRLSSSRHLNPTSRQMSFSGRPNRTPAKATPMQTDGFKFGTLTMVAHEDRPMETAMDLVSGIFGTVRSALPGDLAEQHVQKIRLATGDLTRYFGEAWLDSLPIEWILAVSPERVAAIAPLTRSRFGFGDRVHRFRLLQLHASAFGFHAPAAIEMLRVEALAAQLRRHYPRQG